VNPETAPPVSAQLQAANGSVMRQGRFVRLQKFSVADWRRPCPGIDENRGFVYVNTKAGNASLVRFESYKNPTLKIVKKNSKTANT